MSARDESLVLRARAALLKDLVAGLLRDEDHRRARLLPVLEGIEKDLARRLGPHGIDWVYDRLWEVERSLGYSGKLEGYIASEAELSSYLGKVLEGVSLGASPKSDGSFFWFGVVDTNRPRSPQALKRAKRWLDTWGLLLPLRVATEDLGGHIEEITQLAQEGASTWKIHLRMVAAIFWTACNAVSYLPSRNKSSGRA